MPGHLPSMWSLTKHTKHLLQTLVVKHYSTMARITDLPLELLTPILTELHESSRTSLLDLLISCKALHRATAPIAYKHVTLTWKLNTKRSPMAKFMEYNRHNELVRVMRLDPQRAVLNAFKIGMQHVYTQVELLCDALPSFLKLRTFSITLENSVDHRCMLRGPALARVVRALPQSIVDLELDTEGADSIFEEKQTGHHASHLCIAIGDLLPQLENLRLRVSCICTELFHALRQSNKSKLCRAIINLEHKLDQANRVQAEAVCDCHGPLGKQQKHGVLQPKPFYDFLLSIHAKGIFPHMERFIVLSRQNPRLYHQNAPATTVPNLHYLRVRDVATREMTQYPLRYSSTLNNDVSLDKSLYMIRANSGETHFGTYGMVSTEFFPLLSSSPLRRVFLPLSSGRYRVERDGRDCVIVKLLKNIPHLKS
jgi:hypothetical protein